MFKLGNCSSAEIRYYTKGGWEFEITLPEFERSRFGVSMFEGFAA